MFGNDSAALRSENFNALQEEINKQNRRALGLFAQTGIPLGLVNLVTQMVILGPSECQPQGILLTVYALLLTAFERWLLPKDYPKATAALYAAQTPAMIIAVLLGTVWDMEHQATTIMMFLIIMPVFIMDRPLRLAGWTGFWTLAFVVTCHCVKAHELFLADTVHAVEFWVGSLIVENLVLHVRMDFLENLEQVQYVLRHDRQTGGLSRYALEERIDRLIGRPLVLALADLDHLRLYRDFYGHSAADAMMLAFAKTFGEVFGENAVFRYGGDELMCVFHGDEAACLERLEQCRARLHSFEYDGQRLPLSCCAGYISGTARSTTELRGMIQLAEINANKAKRRGYDRTEGGPFSEEGLRQGILDSSLYTHAEAYEINQLTGLPDMSYFIARADELLGNVADQSREPVLGYLKLLHLRDINNLYGYARGDELIADTARLLRRAFGGRHVCYVTSGEFCVLCYRDEAERGAGIIREGLLGYRDDLKVRSKMGFAACREGQRAISVLDEAKLALNSILESPGRDLRFYDNALDEEIRFKQYILNHVDEAIEKDWLKIYYQPIARAVTGHVCNEEALCRWDDPEYGFLAPIRFIPVLEENGLMYKVNLYVVRQVLRDFQTKREAGTPIVPVSVNLSRRDFERCDMVKEIVALADASGFDRSLLKIEITESAFISNQEKLRREVERFHENGFEVWLDDFGSEYSTLNLLQELDFDLIKLDMKFMRNFKFGSKNHIIVSKVLDMAKQLGVDTLIEGVETIEHFNIMKRLGCDKIQGYLFNRPNPLDYIIKRARSGTGLVFESADAAPYYDVIGRADLSEPMRTSEKGSPRMDSELSTGVIELREGRFFLLRGNESILTRLEAMGLIDGEVQGLRLSMQMRGVPARLTEAAERCRNLGEWVSCEFPGEKGEQMAAYLRLLTEQGYRGGKALLAVLLPGRAG